MGLGNSVSLLAVAMWKAFSTKHFAKVLMVASDLQYVSAV